MNHKLKSLIRVGVIIVADAMGAELGGTRLLMELINRKGPHVVKPMVCGSLEENQNFWELIIRYYFHEEYLNQVPSEILKSIQFLRNNGVEKIAVIGFCWASILVQQMLDQRSSSEGVISCGIGIDGLIRKESYTALAPSKFIIGFEGNERFSRIHNPMADVMFTNNIYPHDIHLLKLPSYHGTIIKGLKEAGLPGLAQEHSDRCIELSEVSRKNYSHWTEEINLFLEEHLFVNDEQR